MNGLNNLKILAEATKVAHIKGCFIVTMHKDGLPKYLLYREVKPKNQFIGSSISANGIRSLAEKA